MKCPHCENELDVLPRCYIYAETYGKSASARTECCKKLVRIIPRMRFEIIKETNDKTEDDWGMQVK